MSKKRKQYSAAFKAKIALAAIKGDQTIAQISARFQIHPAMVNKWKRELLDSAADLFGAGGNKKTIIKMTWILSTAKWASSRWNGIF